MNTIADETPKQEVDYSEKCIKDDVTGDYRPSFPFHCSDKGVVSLLIHNEQVFINRPDKQTSTHEGVSFALLKQNLSTVIQHTQGTVGRVFVADGSASGFMVAPTVIATAHHAVRDDPTPYFDTSVVLPTKQFSIATETGEICYRVINDAERQKLKELDGDQVNDADPSKVTLRRCTQTQSDFNFCNISTASQTFLTPYAEDVTPGMPVAVLGYPGFPSLENRDSNYFTIHNIGPARVRAAFMDSFGFKHLACGVVRDVDEVFGRIFTMTATSLPGVSGGPIIPLVDPTSFCGVHIEGWQDANYNVSVSVHHPHFVIQYARHVVPALPLPISEKVKKYLKRHEALLRTSSSIPERVLELIDI